MKLSVALAVHNEEENIRRCLESVKDLADEIVVVDGSSADRTVEIAKAFNAKVIVTTNPQMFHINKMKAINASTGDWILQLDADEVLSRKLSDEIKEIISMNDDQINAYQDKIAKIELFRRHQALLNQRGGKVGDDSKPYSAFFIARENLFLGRYLMHGGVYPDGVIRLFRKGQAYLPCIDVHEQYEVKGRVGWLANDLLHYDSPTFEKYISRNNRYTTFMATQYKQDNLGKNLKNLFIYMLIKPIKWFLLTYVRHKGFLDSWQGFIFSFFSSLRFAVSYVKYLNLK